MISSEKTEIVKAKAGDKKAMTNLYKVNFKPLYSFVRHKVDTNERAEDICAEAFIKAFEKINSFNEESSFKTWIYTIAKNLVIDWYKKDDRQRTMDDELLETIGEVEEIKLKNPKLKNSIEIIFKDLKDRYKEILEMRFLMNFNIKECAEALKISENNVKVLQNRALKKAKEIAIKQNII